MTSAAADLEFEVTSAAEGPEVGGPSAAEAPEIEVISAAEATEIEVTAAAGGPEVQKYWIYDTTSSSDSIFRAPATIRYGRESDFEPKLVSIGPYHRGRPNLQPMEDTKVWCMSNLLMMRPGDESRGEDKMLFYNRGGSNMDHVPVNPFMKFESRARSYYKEKFNQISDVEFVQMLLLDSCFVIRIILSLYGVIPESMGSLEVNFKEVRSDLLLLENQIPLFFLSMVYYWLFPNASTKLIYALYWFITRDLSWPPSDICFDIESDHLFDFYWKSSVPDTEQLIEIITSHKRQETPIGAYIPRSVPKLIPNATELQIARIKFENYYQSGAQVECSKCIMGMHCLKIENNYQSGVQVEFIEGIMRMHCLKIDSSQVTILVNLIAFENSMPPSLQIISTYIKLLDDLIDLERDVELLQKFGVICNTLSSHTKAVIFFNDIGYCPLINMGVDNPFRSLFENIDKYYKSSWNRGCASLKNNYFNSPWAGLSVFTAGILLILTVLATFYTIYAYYNPRN